MFSPKARRAQEAVDFSAELRQRDGGWALGQIASLGIGSELTALAHDPVQGFLAVGTVRGRVHVFGAPGVQLSWDVGILSKIRHLAFKAGSGFLAVVDAKDTLYVFDLQRLDNHGRPHRDSSLSLRSSPTCLETCAAHSFLLLGCTDGSVDCYDLDRGALAKEARINNLWLAQEEILRRSGLPGAPSRRHIPVCTDIKTHPFNLHLLLVAYEGGVALYNLATRAVERNWEFVLPPGAPGGGNDTQEALFAERRPAATCLAWRPDGLLFAAGHEDGTISFISVEDDMPIMMRTLERADVNKTTEADLFGADRPPANREPIFRLAWSGFPQETYLERASAAFAAKGPASPTIPTYPTLAEGRADSQGGTTLVILGGLLPSDPTGVHLLELPAFSPPSATSGAGKPGSISLAMREALRSSISPSVHHLYPTTAPPEDFLLLPRSSPYYGNSYDPTAIIITSGRDQRYTVLAAPHSSNNVAAFTFPPTTSRAPRPLSLPSALSFSGKETCHSSQIVTVSGLAYRQLLHQFDVADELGERLPLRGGFAFPSPRPSRAHGPLPSTSDQHPRLLLTSHTDLVVRFWDVSDHLLWGRKADEATEPRIQHEYPRPLRHLDVDIKSALQDARANELAAARLLRDRPWELELDKVVFAEENAEVAVTLSTGDVLVWRFANGEHPADVEFDRIEAEANLDETVENALRDLSLDQAGPSTSVHPPRLSSPPTSPPPPSHHRVARAAFLAFPGRSRSGSIASPAFNAERDPQDHYIDLRGAIVGRPDLDGFRPTAAFKFSSDITSKTCLALSNVGFLAASTGSTLLVVDLRGPDVLLVDVPSGGANGKARVDASPITALTWTISSIGKDLDRSPRLLVTQGSGLTRVFELANVGGGWHLSESFHSVQHDSTRGAFATFVLDKHGNPLLANSQQLQLALSHQQAFAAPDHIDARGALTSLWITVSRHRIACFLNIDGPKTAEYEDEHVQFEAATVVQRQGSSALLVQSKDRNLTVLSLPDLSYITRMSFEQSVHDSAGVVSLAPDGDLVQLLDPLDIRLHTVRDLHRPAFPPRTIAFDPSVPVLSPTNVLRAVGSALGAWFGGQKVYSGSEIDAILGGPNRPPPKNRPAPGAPPPIIAAVRAKAEGSGSTTPTQSQFVQDATDSARDIMARTNAALEQRGEYLGYLQERLGTMSDDAARFVAETKKQAQIEAGKRSIAAGFSSGLSSLWKKVP
ncbi:hypothetical protein JCM11641_000514 [Rhodosporidiobolus odoratus]